MKPNLDTNGTRSASRTTFLNFWTLIITIILLFVAKVCESSSNWVHHGANILNHRSAHEEKKISVHTVSKLELRWKFPTNADVTATPAVADGVVYFPCYNGELYALDAKTGSSIWQKNLTHLVANNSVSRATPVVAKDRLLVGLLHPPLVIAVNRSTGELIWATEPLDENPHAVITMSGTVHQGSFYVGVSSVEESTSTCCSFQGSFQKVRVSTGEVLWRTAMLPDNHGVPGGYAGAAVWGSSPSIDEDRRLVYIGTGNDYQVPSSVVQCELQQANRTLPLVPDPCLDPNNYAESILALDMDTGRIVWSRHLGGYDVWSAFCISNTANPNCAPEPGPDYDFGEAPMVLHLEERDDGFLEQKRKRCLVVAGQKSGIVFALDCSTGNTVWSQLAGPGSVAGGATWGSATDGKSLVFTNIANYGNKSFTLLPSDEVTRGGGWVALKASTGDIVWSKANPGANYAFGPVSEANGVVFAGSFSPRGEIYAMNARTGDIIWQFETGASVYGGISISGGCVYAGNGYTQISAFGGEQGTFVYGFCIPDA